MDKIDFVILWVDPNDLKWQEEKNKYMKVENGTNCAKRYRDYNILKYWFRSVSKYASWVNKIHFVTYGHLPDWLDTTNPKLNIVKHEDFIPKEYLPTFSSNTIELNIHRIKGLSEKFVYFNDDMYITKEIKPDFFFSNNLPKDAWCEDILFLDRDSDLNFQYILVNDLKIINQNFNKREVIKSNFFKWFNFKYGKNLIKNVLLYNWKNIPGFHNFHNPSAFLKSTFEKLWDLENDVLHETCLNKFRSDHDVNQYIFRLYQIYSGNFIPKKIKEMGNVITLKDDVDLSLITSSKYYLLCINDGDVENPLKLEERLQDEFLKILDEKCEFEK